MPTRIRLRQLTKEQYNHHVGHVINEQDGTPDDERYAISLCGGAKAIRVRPCRTTPAPLKPPGWRGIQMGCILPERALLRMLCDGRGLQFDTAHSIVDFLKISIVNMSEVSAVKCSSQNSPSGEKAQSMHGTLLREEGSWWISSSRGSGLHFDEFIEYELGPVPRRCEFVSIKIPPLPYGPLSVRKFHLETPSDASDTAFQRATPDFITLDTDQLQEFALVTPLESQFVRVVCTENAAGLGFNSIGFFDIIFS